VSFFAVLLALVIEQLKPLPRGNFVHDAMLAWTRSIGRNFDAGQRHHAWIVWCISVLVPALAVGGTFIAIAHASLPAALAFNVLVLYVTLGFRQFSHRYTGIRDALARGDEEEARRLLADWRRLDASELPRTELLRHVIEHSLLAAHRHVFGVFFWFVVLSTVGLGPAGAVLYRMAEFMRRYWATKSKRPGATVKDWLPELSQRLFGWIDHVPARLTAFGFAVVGNFEEAVAGWRRDADLWLHPNDGIILAAAAGAVGVRLGGGATAGIGPDRPPPGESGFDGQDAQGPTAGAPAQTGHLLSVVGLVWRSVVLWMLLLALLSLANLVG